MPPRKPTPDRLDTARRLRHLRRRCQLSMRRLAHKAGLTAGYISGVEAGRISPTIASLRKLLNAMDTDIGGFFSEQTATTAGPVFRRETMRAVRDRKRMNTMILPSRPDVRLLMLDEDFLPGERPVYEALAGDLAGYVLQGDIVLEIKGQPPAKLRPGDAFYIPARVPARGRAAGGAAARVVTAQLPPTVGK